MGKKKGIQVSTVDRRHDYESESIQFGSESTRKVSSTNKRWLTKVRNEEVTIGLDLGTNTTGIAIIRTETDELLKLAYVKLSDTETLNGKAQLVVHCVGSILDQMEIEQIANIFVEEPLKAFKAGASSAGTIQLLSRFNGACCYALSSTFGIDPVLLNVNSARKLLGIRIDRKDKTRSTKDKVREFVVANFPEVVESVGFVTMIPTRGKNKGKEVPVPEMEDALDAFVVAKAGNIQVLANKAED